MVKKVGAYQGWEIFKNTGNKVFPYFAKRKSGYGRTLRGKNPEDLRVKILLE